MMNAVVFRYHVSVCRSMERSAGQPCTCSAKKSQPKRTKSRRAKKTSMRNKNEGFGESIAPPDNALPLQDSSNAIQSKSIEPGPERVLRRQDAFKERSMTPVILEDIVVTDTPAQKLERENVLTVCRVTSLGMAVIGIVATFATPMLLEMSSSGIESVSQASLMHLPDAQNLAIGIIAGCAITAARFGLTQGWDDLAKSTNAANAQVLWTQPAMGAADIVQIACLPAVSEEILFRGAVVGNLGGGTGAVALVALLFGYLHVSGPRNYASGIFAGIAGLVYGLVFSYSTSVLAAAVAHCVGNLSSAALWLATNTEKDGPAASKANEQAE